MATPPTAPGGRSGATAPTPVAWSGPAGASSASPGPKWPTSLGWSPRSSGSCWLEAGAGAAGRADGGKIHEARRVRGGPDHRSAAVAFREHLDGRVRLLRGDHAAEAAAHVEDLVHLGRRDAGAVGDQVEDRRGRRGGGPPGAPPRPPPPAGGGGRPPGGGGPPAPPSPPRPPGARGGGPPRGPGGGGQAPPRKGGGGTPGGPPPPPNPPAPPPRRQTRRDPRR